MPDHAATDLPAHDEPRPGRLTGPQVSGRRFGVCLIRHNTEVWTGLGGRAGEVDHHVSATVPATGPGDRREFRGRPQAVRGRQHASRSIQADSSVRPLRRRAARMARPARVRIRSRNPWVFARRRLFGWKVRLLTVSLHHNRCRDRNSAGMVLRSGRKHASEFSTGNPPGGRHRSRLNGTDRPWRRSNRPPDFPSAGAVTPGPSRPAGRQNIQLNRASGTASAATRRDTPRKMKSRTVTPL